MTPIPPARRAPALLGLPLALALAACTSAGEPVTTSPPIRDGGLSGTCDAKAAQQFVGQVLDEAVAERARAAAGARGLRVIRPGMAVTADYRAGRLNIDVDDSGRITRVHCG